MLKTPVSRCLRIFSEHSLSAARRVNDYSVKKSSKMLCQRVGAHVCHNCVCYPHPLNIFAQNFCARRRYFIRNKHAASIERTGNLCAFPARSGTKVKHNITAAHAEQLSRCLGGRLLRIKQTCRACGVSALFSVVIKTAFAPRDRLSAEARKLRKLMRCNFKRVRTQALKRLFIIFSNKSVIFASEFRFHSCHEIRRQIHSFTSNNIVYHIGGAE